MLGPFSQHIIDEKQPTPATRSPASTPSHFCAITACQDRAPDACSEMWSLPSRDCAAWLCDTSGAREGKTRSRDPFRSGQGTRSATTRVLWRARCAMKQKNRQTVLTTTTYDITPPLEHHARIPRTCQIEKCACLTAVRSDRTHTHMDASGGCTR